MKKVTLTARTIYRFILYSCMGRAVPSRAGCNSQSIAMIVDYSSLRYRVQCVYRPLYCDWYKGGSIDEGTKYKIQLYLLVLSCE